MDEQTWSTMIDINLTGVWKTVKAAVPHILTGQRGGLGGDHQFLGGPAGQRQHRALLGR